MATMTSYAISINLDEWLCIGYVACRLMIPVRNNLKNTQKKQHLMGRTGHNNINPLLNTI
jgi:hypothetical protein